MRGERITQSGISKGKDVAPGIYPRKKLKTKLKVEEQVTNGYKSIQKKTNVDEIKETFGPKPKNYHLNK